MKLPGKLGLAVGLALVIWASGFMWGTFVLTNQTLAETAAIPFISSNPFISFPILIGWFFLGSFFTKLYLKKSPDDKNALLGLGIVFAGTNILLDVGFLGFAFDNFGFFTYLSPWLAYLMLLLIPLRAQKKIPPRKT